MKQARNALSVVLAALMSAPSSSAVQLDRKPTQLNVQVEAGNNLTNELRSRKPVELVIRVTDEADRPVPGAIVTAFLSTTGAGLQAPGGTSTVTAQTDDNGRVRFAGLLPFGSGQFSIRVVATYGGLTGRAMIGQTNVAAHFMPPTKWAILGGVAATAAGLGLGLYFGQRDTTNPTTVTVGTGTVRPAIVLGGRR
jgi:hypothetical protein